MKYPIITLMKNFLLLLLTIPLFSFSQVNCDTLMIDPAEGEYTSDRTRGYWFRANSSFTISAVKAGDGNSLGVNATSQSIEIIQFTALNLFSDTIPKDFTSILAGDPNPHTSMFHAQNVPLGWVTCNVNIVKDRYYAILGAKNNTVVSGVNTQMYNSTITSSSQAGIGIYKKIMLNGDSTVFWRAGIQESLADGPGTQGQFFHDGPHSQGRIHTLICTGTTNVEEITRDKELVKIVDQLGREINRTKNSPMFYIYNDGTTEKRVVID